MYSLRAIENGFSMVRPVYNGYSYAVDHNGKLLADISSFGHFLTTFWNYYPQYMGVFNPSWLDITWGCGRMGKIETQKEKNEQPPSSSRKKLSRRQANDSGM
jgi:hypothetical protein